MKKRLKSQVPTKLEQKITQPLPSPDWRARAFFRGYANLVATLQVGF